MWDLGYGIVYLLTQVRRWDRWVDNLTGIDDISGSIPDAEIPFITKFVKTVAKLELKTPGLNYGELWMKL